MKPIKTIATSFAIIAACGACSTTHPIIADKSVLLSKGVTVSYESLAGAALVGAAVWYLADPLAPTWGIERKKLAEDRYRIDLRQKRFAVGGDGEAEQVFERAAHALAEENGFAGYTVLSYTEGIQSGPLLSQRVSRGVVQLNQLTQLETAAQLNGMPPAR
ncbi:MAG: hypothetical protein ABI771_06630 [Betaproteobacteria bacterium]